MKQITHKHSRDEVSSSVDTNGTVHDSLEKTHPNEEPSININILTRKILMCQISDIRAKICVNSNYSLSPFCEQSNRKIRYDYELSWNHVIICNKVHETDTAIYNKELI